MQFLKKVMQWNERMVSADILSGGTTWMVL